MKAIEITDLCFSNQDRKIFEHFNLSIESQKWLTIVGPNGSGKSMLAKLIVGSYEYTGTIKIAEEEIGIVYASSDLNFILDKVSDELDQYKKQSNLSDCEYNIKKDKIISLFGLKPLLNCKPFELSNSYRVLISLASILIYEPKILILDGTLDYLDNIQKEKVMKILKNYQKKGMTIINITNDIEQSLIGDEILLLYNGQVKLYKDKKSFFDDEKLLKKYGINLPFIIPLSNKLKYYNMVSKNYYSIDELVDDLWK